MVKYLMTATALKLFSLNGMTRGAYRKVGNILGQKKRKTQDISAYIERGELLRSICEKYGLLEDGKRLLELGTGWMHWFGLYVRLHGNISVDLFDVWDNRQFEALHSLFRTLDREWAASDSVDKEARKRLETLLDAGSFQELYEKLGMHYTIDSNGSLDSYQTESCDCVFSFHVLEHVGKDHIRDTIGQMHRILKSGGYCVHQIGIDDHLSHYDKKESPKNYLRYSQAQWKRFFENDVQYHNRLQSSDFMSMFEAAGFELVETEREHCSIDELPVHKEWATYPQEVLETTILTVVYKKS